MTRQTTKTDGESMEHKKMLRFGMSAGMVIVLVLLTCIVCLTYLVSRPVVVSASCTVDNWTLLPDGLTWAGEIRMAPDHATCTINGEAPMIALMGKP